MTGPDPIEYLDDQTSRRVAKAIGGAMIALLELSNVIDEAAEDYPALVEQSPTVIYSEVLEQLEGLVKNSPDCLNGCARLFTAVAVVAECISRALYTGGQSALAQTN
jgi:hypothetical protein